MASQEPSGKRLPESSLSPFDAYSPMEIAERVEKAGITKARLPLVPLFILSALAGVFIGFGSLLFTLVASDPLLPFALSRILGGLVFCIGLILVTIAGAELFTGNNLLVIAWADGKLTTGEVLGNWVVVFFGNLVGACSLAVCVALSNIAGLGGGTVAAQAVRIAAAKASLPFADAFFRGILCNSLVCLAVWLAMAGRSVTDKVVAILFPITCFVALGFEHSVANMFFIPLGMLLKDLPALPAGPDTGVLTWYGFVSNLLPVTLGNIVGGSVMVGFVYAAIYRKGLSRMLFKDHR